MGKIVAVGVIALSFIYVCVYTIGYKICGAARKKHEVTAKDYKYILE